MLSAIAGNVGYKFKQPWSIQMHDSQSAIPKCAYINAQIIQEADRCGALYVPIRKIENYYQLPAGSLRVKNPAYLLGLLYCLIVVPKEHWLRDKQHPILAKIKSEQLLRLVSVSEESPKFRDHPSYALLHHLRNAVAHVHFTLSDGNFTFWDQDPRTQKETFRGTFTLDNLGEFLSTIGALLANQSHCPVSQPHQE